MSSPEHDIAFIMAQANLAMKVAQAEKAGTGVTLDAAETATLVRMLRLLASGVKEAGR